LPCIDTHAQAWGIDACLLKTQGALGMTISKLHCAHCGRSGTEKRPLVALGPTLLCSPEATIDGQPFCWMLVARFSHPVGPCRCTERVSPSATVAR